MKKYILVLLCILSASKGKAQLNPLKGQYFQNRYLANPAMAGYSGRAEVFVDYANQWSKMEGAPSTFALSGSLPISEKASVGVNILNDVAGLLKQTHGMASFAYKVSFAEDHAIRFGASATWSQDRLDLNRASASASIDPELAGYNDRESYLDGNFGATYQLKNFEAQFSYLSLNQNRNSNISRVSSAVFYSAVSYQFDMNESLSVKPLLAYRGFTNFDNQLDVAVEWTAKTLRFYTMYHTNKSFTGGIGYLDKSGFIFSTMYNSGPENLNGFSGGVFDLSLGLRF